MSEHHPNEDDESWGLVCPFLNHDPVFAQGVAFGQLWCRMREEIEISDYILSEIDEQVRVAASRLGFEITKLEPWLWQGEETGWILIEMHRAEASA